MGQRAGAAADGRAATASSRPRIGSSRAWNYRRGNTLQFVTLGVAVFFAIVLPRIPPVCRKIERRNAAMTEGELRERKDDFRSARGYIRFLSALTIVAGVIVCFAGNPASRTRRDRFGRDRCRIERAGEKTEDR
jgi:hypothetical protein